MRQSILFFLLMTAGSASAQFQFMSIGVKGGASLTDPSGNRDESRRYIVGPSVEFRLPGNFAVEASALYQRLGTSTGYAFNYTSIVGPGGISYPFIASYLNRQRANAWEFPIVGKYYFRSRSALWRPYIATGYSLRTVGIQNSTRVTTVDSTGASTTSQFKNTTRSDLGVGAVAAAGVRFHTGRLSFQP